MGSEEKAARLMISEVTLHVVPGFGGGEGGGVRGEEGLVGLMLLRGHCLSPGTSDGQSPASQSLLCHQRMLSAAVPLAVGVTCTLHSLLGFLTAPSSAFHLSLPSCPVCSSRGAESP